MSDTASDKQCNLQIWSDIRQAISVAMNIVNASRDVWKPYWAAQQRFFKLLCVSLKAGLSAESVAAHEL